MHVALTASFQSTPGVTKGASGLTLGRVFLFLLILVLSTGCAKPETDTREFFIGKWQSSRLVTPLYLHENGEWEIRKDDGAVLQYGVWEYKSRKIVWTHKAGSTISTDINPVIRVNPSSFELAESDQTVTLFKKLD